MHPHPDGKLAHGTPAASGSASFCYDPTDPTPSLGGRMLTASGAGYRDDSALASRSDTISFTGTPLASSVDIIGTPRVELSHTSDNPNCDVFIRLHKAALHPLVIPLDPTAYRVDAGHRLRLHIAGGAFPHYERHLGTDEPLGSSTVLVSTNHVIDLAATRMVLPVQSPVR